MAKLSFLLSLLVAALVAISTSAFAPTSSFQRPATSLDVRIKVVVGDGEPIESALRRFKREINKSGHLMDLRHKRYFENSQEKKKRKVKEGRLRRKFERMQRRRMANRV
ncbi:30S ribosomal protein S21 [Nitzschia inconspicua]|uniref:30S ribosomal protein S21 n=1 Tax=Nitzschia inconspicua TaxID=303405 RepID=A0A9K3LKC9_9STRA|nr:30S ribosomal protein S21 [Nitzschia inconspicua]